MLKEIVDKLGPAYTFVRPDHLAELYAADLEGRKQLISIPDHAFVVEGQSITVPVAVQNLTTSALPISVKSTGLERAVLEPVQATVPPGKQITRTITGKPTGDEIKLAVNVKVAGKCTCCYLTRLLLLSLTSGRASGKLMPAPSLRSFATASSLKSKPNRSWAPRPSCWPSPPSLFPPPPLMRSTS